VATLTRTPNGLGAVSIGIVRGEVPLAARRPAALRLCGAKKSGICEGSEPAGIRPEPAAAERTADSESRRDRGSRSQKPPSSFKKAETASLSDTALSPSAGLFWHSVAWGRGWCLESIDIRQYVDVYMYCTV
jgi:hypothetical protein